MELKNKEGSSNKTNLSVQMRKGEVREFEEVEECLGTFINNKCREETEIRLRIAKGNSVGSLNRLIRSKNISPLIKLRIYKTILRPIPIWL